MGTLSFTSFTYSTAAVNLDTINAGGEPDDWAEYQTTLTAANNKLGGGTTISAALFGGGSTSNNTADARTISWTNGTPTTSGSNTDCVFNSSFSAGLGIAVTVLADTSVRTAWFLIGAYNSSTTPAYISDASLSDSSASPLHDTTSLTGVGHTTAFNPYVVIASYSANSSGQHATFNFYNPATSPQTVTLQAIAVAVTGGGGPATILMGQACLIEKYRERREREFLRGRRERERKFLTEFYQRRAA